MYNLPVLFEAFVARKQAILIHTHTHARTHERTHAHAHTHTHTYTHTHIHTQWSNYQKLFELAKLWSEKGYKGKGFFAVRTKRHIRQEDIVLCPCTIGIDGDPHSVITELLPDKSPPIKRLKDLNLPLSVLSPLDSRTSTVLFPSFFTLNPLPVASGQETHLSLTFFSLRGWLVSI